MRGCRSAANHLPNPGSNVCVFRVAAQEKRKRLGMDGELDSEEASGERLRVGASLSDWRMFVRLERMRTETPSPPPPSCPLCAALYAPPSMRRPLCAAVYAPPSMRRRLCAALYAPPPMRRPLCAAVYAPPSMRCPLCAKQHPPMFTCLTACPPSLIHTFPPPPPHTLPQKYLLVP
eukprot:365795-Chlamydomonas_euryale.AAC.3